MKPIDFLVIFILIVAIVIYLKLDTIKELFEADDGSMNVEQSGNRDIAEVIRQNGKNYLILYASQTGTAEDYARKFGKELISKFGLNVMCADVEHYDFDTLNELPENVLVTFFVSTYGEGDFPDPAVRFGEYLSQVDIDALSNLKFSLFGLGNTTYEFYNGAAKKTLKYLMGAGATQIGRLGLGDDGAGTTEEDYLSWKEEVFEQLKGLLKLDEREEKFSPLFKYTTLDSVDNKVFLGEPSSAYLPGGSSEGQNGPFSSTNPYLAPIIKSSELLVQGSGRNCIHSEFDISGAKMSYKTGDHLGVLPANANEKVKQFLTAFSLKGDTVFSLEAPDAATEVHFPCPTTIESAVRYYLEITGPVSRQFLSQLVEFAPEDIKEKVAALAKSKTEFAKEITGKKFNLADAILYLNNGKPWTSVPFNFLAETLPRMQPRFYSISSSSLAEPTVVHTTTRVENMPNEETGSPTLGVTTNLLRNIQLSKSKDPNMESLLPVTYDLNGPRGLYEGYKLPVFVRSSTFKLPAEVQKPLIMIGPGTGVSPLRGFVRERVEMCKIDSLVTEKMGKMLLFYGCRDENDYLYKNEWVEYAKALDGKFEIDVAFSRVSDKKVYVQNKIQDRKDEVAELLKAGAYVYVCGDAGRMARDVQKALTAVLASAKGISEQDAENEIKEMKNNGTYQEDVW